MHKTLVIALLSFCALLAGCGGPDLSTPAATATAYCETWNRFDQSAHVSCFVDDEQAELEASLEGIEDDEDARAPRLTLKEVKDDKGFKVGVIEDETNGRKHTTYIVLVKQGDEWRTSLAETLKYLYVRKGKKVPERLQ